MPLSLDALAAKTRKLAVLWDGETIDIEYKTARINPAYQSMLQKLADKRGDEAAQWEAVFAVISSWDIVDGGKPLPITRETLAKLPTSLLTAIISAIMEDVNPNLRSGAPSAAGSFRKDS